MRRSVPLIVGLCVPAGCAPDPFETASGLAETLDEYAAHEIGLVGRVVDGDGNPVAGATVESPGISVVTAEDGTYEVPGLERRNRLLQVHADGFRPVVLPVHLVRGHGVTAVEAPPAVLDRGDPTVVRFVFGGDVALGRRFLDPDETAAPNELPADDPQALIQVSDPEPGSRGVFEFVAPLLAAADYPVVNLESPVLDDPRTPHPDKDYVFFTLPDSLPALRWAGIRYVSTGNNHVYDYLDGGILDTLFHLDDAELAHSGAGIDADEAFTPHHEELAGTDYALLSMCSVAGEMHDQIYVATDSKGGAADLRDDARVVDAIERALAGGAVPVPMLHTGQEYTTTASDYARGRFDLVARTGVPLVVGHHPHVAQGFERIGDTLVLHSLGNFAFDQARLETMLGLAATVDVQGDRVVGARVTPVYLEDFRPRLVAGDLPQREIRRLAELTDGVSLSVAGGDGVLGIEGPQPVRQSQTVRLELDIPDEGVVVVDLRGRVPAAASLGRVEVDPPTGVELRVGRDILRHGDFEDYDVDGDLLEASRWNTDFGSVSICTDAPYRGAAALCQARDGGNSSDSVASFRNRVRVTGDAEGTPNKDLTLFGYVRGANAGPATFVVRYYASAGSREFGEQDAVELEAGTWDWRPFWADLDMPVDDPGADPRDGTAHARALRPFLRHSPPREGDGVLSVDEIVVIEWDVTGGAAVDLSTPHGRDFVRLAGPPGPVAVQMTVVLQVPANVVQ